MAMNIDPKTGELIVNPLVTFDIGNFDNMAIFLRLNLLADGGKPLPPLQLSVSPELALRLARSLQATAQQILAQNTPDKSGQH